MAVPPKKDSDLVLPLHDAEEIHPEDVSSVIPEGVDRELAERLSRWFKREMARLGKHRA